jgi:hypothetical protein
MQDGQCQARLACALIVNRDTALPTFTLVAVTEAQLFASIRAKWLAAAQADLRIGARFFVFLFKDKPSNFSGGLVFFSDGSEGFQDARHTV